MGSHIPRLWLPQMGPNDLAVTIDDAGRVHHLRDVLRLKAGETVHAFNETAGERVATVNTVGKNSISLTAGETLRPPEARPALHLFFAPLKRQATEWLVEKATEVGVTHFHPVLTAHTQVRSINPERLQGIAVEAIEQCGRLVVPQFMPIVDMMALKHDAPIFAAVEAARGTAHLLPAALSAHKGNAVFIGPEGGFSDAESEWLAKQQGIVPVSLGVNILRAETAAVLAAGIISLYAERR